MNKTINLVTYCLVFVAKASFISFSHGVWRIIELWRLSYMLRWVILAFPLQQVGDSLGEATFLVNRLAN